MADTQTGTQKVALVFDGAVEDGRYNAINKALAQAGYAITRYGEISEFGESPDKKRGLQAIQEANPGNTVVITCHNYGHCADILREAGKKEIPAVMYTYGNTTENEIQRWNPNAVLYNYGNGSGQRREAFNLDKFWAAIESAIKNTTAAAIHPGPNSAAVALGYSQREFDRDNAL